MTFGLRWRSSLSILVRSISKEKTMIGISEGMVEKLRAARGARTVPMAEVVARLGTVVVGHRDIA